MKKTIILLVSLLAFSAGVFAENANAKSVADSSVLPENAKSFVMDNFKDRGIKSVKHSTFWGTPYKVKFVDGTVVEFDKNGDWTEIEASKSMSLPEGAIPSDINSFINKNYKGASVKEIKRTSKGYEVELSNDIDLYFDQSFKLYKMDD